MGIPAMFHRVQRRLPCGDGPGARFEIEAIAAALASCKEDQGTHRVVPTGAISP
jgi:hypothetical protein